MDLEKILKNVKKKIMIKGEYENADVTLNQQDNIEILIVKQHNFRGQEIISKPHIELIPETKIDSKRFHQIGIDINSIQNELAELNIELI